MGGRANHVHYLHFAMRAKTGRSSATMRPQRTPMPRRETNPRRGHDTTTLPAEYDCPSRAQIKRGNKLNVELNSGLLSMFTFHPLSLMLPADLDDSKFLTQLTETFARQRFRHDISDLLPSMDVLNVHPPASNALSNKVESNISMLAPIMKNRVLTEG
jgi:hypothetical protein